MLEQISLVLAQAEDAPPVLPQDGGGAAGELQNGAPVNGTTPQDQQQGGGFAALTPLFFLLLLVVLFVLMSSGQRREKKRRAQMIEALKKGDKIQTVGGILGTVVEVRENEIVVKVDENANTRLRFARSAVQTVVEDKSAE